MYAYHDVHVSFLVVNFGMGGGSFNYFKSVNEGDNGYCTHNKKCDIIIQYTVKNGS